MDEAWATLWEAVADAMPDSVALAAGDRLLQWAEVDDRASRLAAGLASLGVRATDTVAICAYNIPEHLEAVFASYKLRACPVNLNVRYRSGELAEVLADAAPAAILFSSSLGAEVVPACESLDRPCALVEIDDGPPGSPSAEAYEDLLRSHVPAPRVVRSGEDLALLYTGGTTGSPRGVVYRHRDAVAMNAFAAYGLAGLPVPDDAASASECARELRSKRATPTVLPASPLAHGTALNLAQAAWLLGGQVVLLPGRSFDAHQLWRAVEGHRVTEVGIVGDSFARPMVAALEQAEAAGRPYDLSSLNRILSSGAPWSPRMKRALADRGSFTLVETIGASEGGPAALSVVAPGADPSQAPFVLGEHACLLTEDGRELPPGTGEVGLLAMKPPIPLRYHRDPERSARVFRTIGGQDYAIAGDHAIVESDGSVVFLGRGSLCINTGGEKVHPEEVEAVLRMHPEVADANVVGLPDETWGQAVTAVVAFEPGSDPPTETEVRTWVRDRLADYKVPKRVVTVGEIPRTTAGKARYEWAVEVATAALG